MLFTVPGHVESTLRHVSFERRQKRYEEACSIFETALRISSVDAKSGPFLSMQYGLFLERVLAAPDRVREMYERTLEKFPEHKGLWMAFIHFESARSDTDKVLALYARAVAEDNKLTADERIDLWQSYLEYAADWVNNPATVRKLQENFRTLHPTYAYKAETAKKRPLFDSSHTTDSPSKVARTAATATTTPAATAAYTPAAAAAAAQYQYQYGQVIRVREKGAGGKVTREKNFANTETVCRLHIPNNRLHVPIHRSCRDHSTIPRSDSSHSTVPNKCGRVLRSIRLPLRLYPDNVSSNVLVC
jgi:hypothetical protein